MGLEITQEQIADLVGRVHWHGKYFAMICPFHDDREPSLLVYRDGAYCLGCRKNFTLRNLYYRLKRRRTIRVADRDLGPNLRWNRLPPADELAEEAHALLIEHPGQDAYIRQRGIASRIEPNRIGWWNGYYTFPGYDEHFDFSGLILRANAETQKHTGNRYLTPPHQEPFLYVTDWNRVARASVVFITFGIIDALVVADLGFASASPSNGQTPNSELFTALRKPLVIIPDRKAEEVDTANRLIADLGWRGQLLILPYEDGTEDPADFAKSPNLRNTLTAQLARF